MVCFLDSSPSIFVKHQNKHIQPSKAAILKIHSGT